jgi:peptidoglycan hydrolase CwlO-like protein
MKKDIIIAALIAILFVLVMGSIIASFTFYKEYKDKIDYLEQQSMTGKARIDGVESKVDGFKTTIDDITNQVKTYSDSLKGIQSTVSLSEEERKALLAKVEEMKKDLQGWQKDYSSTVIDIKQSMLTIKDDLDKMHNKPRDIELGKITVKQEEKKAVVAEEPKNVKEGSQNFKSGNVRKVGAY